MLSRACLVGACAVLVACSAAPAPSPCDASHACSRGSACIAGGCRAPEAPPVSESARRLLFTPREVAIVASKAIALEPDGIALGRAASGSITILMRFAVTLGDGAAIERALLVLDPVAGSSAADGPLSLSVARVLEPWNAAETTYARRPRLALADETIDRRLPATEPLRIDVTKLVRRWTRRSAEDQGLALLADGTVPRGMVFRVQRGGSPRLEVYAR